MKPWPDLLDRCLYMVKKYIDQPWDHTIIQIIMYTEYSEKFQTLNLLRTDYFSDLIRIFPLLYF